MTTNTIRSAPRSVFTAVAATMISVSLIAFTGTAVHAATVNSPLTISDWRDQVEVQIDRTLRMPAASIKGSDHIVAQVRVFFAADGAVDHVALADTTGMAAFDREALRTAEAIRYPALPEGLRGKPQSVMMQLYFADAPATKHRDAIRAMQMTARGEGKGSVRDSAAR